MPKVMAVRSDDKRLIPLDTEIKVFEAYFCLAMTVEEAAHYARVDKMTVSKYWNEAGLPPLDPSIKGRPRITEENSPPGYVSLSETGRRLGMTRAGARYLFTQGKLEGYREGSHVWISKESINERLTNS